MSFDKKLKIYEIFCQTSVSRPCALGGVAVRVTQVIVHSQVLKFVNENNFNEYIQFQLGGLTVRQLINIVFNTLVFIWNFYDIEKIQTLNLSATK